jgi:hypothetical protein
MLEGFVVQAERLVISIFAWKIENEGKGAAA